MTISFLNDTHVCTPEHFLMLGWYSLSFTHIFMNCSPSDVCYLCDLFSGHLCLHFPVFKQGFFGSCGKLEKEFNLTVFWKCWLRLLESYSGVFFSKAFVYSLLLPTFLFRRYRATKSALTLAFPSLSFGSALIRSPLKMKWGSTTWRWRRSSLPCCLPGIRDPESESASRTSNWPQSCPTQSYAEHSGSDRISPLTS